MRRQYTIITLFALLILSPILSLKAQHSSKEYEEGVIFLKLKNSSGIVLPEIESKGEMGLIAKSNLNGLASILTKYQTTKLLRPFTVLKNPDLDNTYKIYFDQKGLEMDLILELQELGYVDFAERTLVPENLLKVHSSL